VRDFARESFTDIEGDPIPSEKMLIVDLEDGRSFAVRPSGTEPKIKYYLYGRRRPEPGATFGPDELPAIVGATGDSLDALWKWLEADIESRLR
jgi:phosphoglucomutase